MRRTPTIYDPAFGRHGKALGLIGALDNIEPEQAGLEDRPPTAALGVELEQDG